MSSSETLVFQLKTFFGEYVDSGTLSFYQEGHLHHEVKTSNGRVEVRVPENITPGTYDIVSSRDEGTSYTVRNVFIPFTAHIFRHAQLHGDIQLSNGNFTGLPIEVEKFNPELYEYIDQIGDLKSVLDRIAGVYSPNGLRWGGSISLKKKICIEAGAIVQDGRHYEWEETTFSYPEIGTYQLGIEGGEISLLPSVSYPIADIYQDAEDWTRVKHLMGYVPLERGGELYYFTGYERKIDDLFVAFDVGEKINGVVDQDEIIGVSKIREKDRVDFRFTGLGPVCQFGLLYVYATLDYFLLFFRDTLLVALPRFSNSGLNLDVRDGISFTSYGEEGEIHWNTYLPQAPSMIIFLQGEEVIRDEEDLDRYSVGTVDLTGIDIDWSKQEGLTSLIARRNSYYAKVMGDNPDIYWRLEDETISTVDRKGNFDGFIYGDVVTGIQDVPFEGYLNYSYYFTGDTGYIQFSVPAMNTPYPLSLECWLKPEEIREQGICVRGAYGWQLRMDYYGRVIYENYPDLDGYTATQPLIPNEWTHIVALYDDVTGEMRIYRNGVLEDTTLTYSGNAQRNILSYNQSSAEEGTTTGLRAIQSVLTNSTEQAIQGTRSFRMEGINGTQRGISFDGVNDRIGFLNFSNSYTLSPYFSPQSVEVYTILGSDVTTYQILTKAGGTTYGYYMYIQNGNLVFDAYVNTTLSTITHPVTANEAAHFSVVSDGTTITLYKNGVEVASILSDLRNGGSGEGIGANTGGENPFTGFISFVRTWEKALTVEEINQYLYSQLDGTQTGLYALYNIEELAAGKNLLTYNHSSAEEGTTTGLLGFGGGYSLTATTEYVIEGTYSFKVISNNDTAGFKGFQTDNSLTVPPSSSVSAQATIKALSGSTIRLRLRLFSTLDGSVISEHVSPLTTSDGNEQTLVTSGVSPSQDTTARVIVHFYGAVTGETFYADKLQLEVSSSPTAWVPGGTLVATDESGNARNGIVYGSPLVENRTAPADLNYYRLDTYSEQKFVPAGTDVSGSFEFISPPGREQYMAVMLRSVDNSTSVGAAATTVVTDGTTQYISVTQSAIAQDVNAFIVVQTHDGKTGDVTYVDKLQLEHGGVTPWQPGIGGLGSTIELSPSSTGDVPVSRPRKNLLTYNQSSIETDTSGWEVIGSSIVLSRSTAVVQFGEGVLKVDVVDGSNYLGAKTRKDAAVVPSGQSIKPSLYVLVPQGVAFDLLSRAFSFASPATQVGFSSYSFFVGTGNWQRVEGDAYSVSEDSIPIIRVRLRNYTGAQTFYVDGAQIEIGSVATEWEPGGTPQLERWKGNVDEVAYYTKTLSDDQILNHITTPLE